MTNIKRIAFALAASVTMAVIMMLVIDWWSGMHFVNFKLGDQYEVELTIDECTSCFMEYEAEFDVTIHDINGKAYDFEFRTLNTPAMRFMLSEEQPAMILIQAIDEEFSLSWLIDLKQNSIAAHHGKWPEGFETLAELNLQYQIEYK